jgi:TolB-like protein/class 3 adenylate cyclase/Tfp pilus assembly protein PilF
VEGEPVQRRLAAILAADVAGYSRLIGEDEEGTIARLRALRRELIDPAIAAHRGRIVKTTGDGILIEFPSVVDAVRCAVEVQQEMTAKDANQPQDKRIAFRVGIHIGDVVVEGDDLLGDGVNVAARLEGIAEPGGVYISEDVYRQVRDRVPSKFIDTGEQQFKNIARPMRVYRLADGLSSAPPRSGVALPLPDKPSIAVLPFTNMSGDPEQEYFADGVVEEITAALSRVRSFFVIARNSTFTYKGKAVLVQQVSRELGVRYVLEGSVRKAGDRVRITAQLIEATTGNHIWSERYDGNLKDIFELQDRITESVVAAIEPELFAAENLRIQSRPPESLDAWGCVIRGLLHLARYSREDNRQARSLLHQAVAFSPSYARAHSLLAVAEVRSALLEGASLDAVLGGARQHAQAAMTLDDGDPWSNFSIGVVESYASRYDDAIAWFHRAIELNPSFALAYGFLAGALSLSGQPDAAIEAVKRAIRISPRDPFNATCLHFAAIAHFVAERYAEGVECEKQALRERPNHPSALRYLTACYIGLGQIDRAREVVSEVLRLYPESSIKRNAYGYFAHARASDRERFVAALRAAGLPEE